MSRAAARVGVGSVTVVAALALAFSAGAVPRSGGADAGRPHDHSHLSGHVHEHAHGHARDQRGARLVPLGGAVGLVPDPEDLGPVHEDPLPEGVSLSDPVDTASLYARAGLPMPTRTDLERADAAPGEPLPAGAVPPGTPSTAGLTQHVAPSCSGTGSDGPRVQALYVREASRASRLSTVLPLLRNEIANVDDVFALSARKTGGDLRVRWVHEGCVPDVEEVVVPDGSLSWNFWDTVDALEDLGYTRKDRKYLAFTEANDLCGIGTMYQDVQPRDNANDGSAASYSRVDTPCWSTGVSIPAHELTHNLGGVLRRAPHATDLGHCYDESDLMCYSDEPGVSMKHVCPSGQEQLLDCNNDDYFHTAPAPGSFLADSWNTARSSFLDAVAAPEPPGDAGPATRWSPVTVSAAAPAVLGAVLTDAVTGATVAGAPVVLQTRPREKDVWRELDPDLSTGPLGEVVAAVPRDRAAWYRFVFDGDTDLPGSVSGEVLVKAVTRAGIDWRASAKQVVGRLAAADGSALAGEQIVLQRRYAGAVRWVAVTSRTTDDNGRVSLGQRPDRATYFRWVYRGSDEQLPVRSRAVRARRPGA